MYVKVLKWWKKINASKGFDLPIGLAWETMVEKYYSSESNFFKAIYNIMVSINENITTRNLLDPCDSSNNLFEKMSESSFQEFKRKMNLSIQTIERSLLDLSSEGLKVVFGDDFPKCQIINDEEAQKQKEKNKSKGLKHYSE